jgi:hypothetical protein
MNSHGTMFSVNVFLLNTVTSAVTFYTQETKQKLVPTNNTYKIAINRKIKIQKKCNLL